MKKINYKGRCEKRKVSKCGDICRTYNKIQSAMVDMLENNDDVVSFECNVRLKGVADDLYSSDFVIKKTDGSTLVRECVWRINLQKPSYAKLLDMNEFRARKVTWAVKLFLQEGRYLSLNKLNHFLNFRKNDLNACFDLITDPVVIRTINDLRAGLTFPRREDG